MQNHQKVSKYLSLILRHKPETIGIKLDQNGWVDVEELIQKMKIEINMQVLEDVVVTNDKKRFAFNEDKTKIRANQGHSIMVDLDLKRVTPPEFLYHGTTEKFIKSIRREGLRKQNRRYVHLSSNKQTAISVGKRHGKPIILKINTKNMSEKGYLFYLSENKVWLTDEVPYDFITENVIE